MEFGYRFKNIRVEKKMTQDDLANVLQVSRQAVSNWENDKNLPDLEMLIKISKVYGITLDQLVNEELEPITKEKNINNKETYQKISKTGNKHLSIKAISAGGFIILGIICLWIKTNSVVYVDPAGIVKENSFLIPLSIAMFAVGITFLITDMLQKYKITGKKVGYSKREKKK